MITCIIPARSGSKRIKDKNLKKFFGKPLIYYSIKLAIRSKVFNDIIVSTDSKKIEKIAKNLGANVPFLRSKKNSLDKTPIIDVLQEVVSKLKIKEEYICCLYPTAPLLKENDLKRGIKMIKNNYDQIIAISEFVSPIQRALIKYRRSLIKFINPKYRFSRSQDLDKTFLILELLQFIKKKTFQITKISKILKLGL